jgi:hypothetical protein
VISRLTAEWQGEYERWQKRDLSARRYVYRWADGVFLQARMEDHGQCMLVLMGATPEGKKELIGFQVDVGDLGGACACPQHRRGGVGANHFLRRLLTGLLFAAAADLSIANSSIL